MLEPDPHIDSCLQIVIEGMQETLSLYPNLEVEDYSSRTLAGLRLFVRNLADSSQMTEEQRIQVRQLLTLLDWTPGNPMPKKPRQRRRNV